MKTVPNYLIWVISLSAAFGSWCMQQPQTFTWAQITTPFNLGSLICALTAVFLAGKGVTQKEQ